MKVYPFDEVVVAVKKHLANRMTVFQQFVCGKCLAKQTIDEPDKLYTSGKCEECGFVTNIREAGCNYMLVSGLKGKEDKGDKGG